MLSLFRIVISPLNPFVPPFSCRKQAKDTSIKLSASASIFAEARKGMGVTPEFAAFFFSE